MLCGLTGFLYFLADTQNLYFAGRFFQGIAEVPIWALAPALLSIQYASEKGKFMGMYNASLHCGLTLGGLISIIAFRICQGNESFLVFAGLSILGGVITALFAKSPDQNLTAKMTAVQTSEVWLLLSNRTNLLVFSGVMLYGAGYGIFITIIPAFLISTKGVSQTTISVFFALFYIALSLSQLIAGTWSDRKGRKPAMIVGLLMAALGVATFHKGSYPWFIVLLALASLGLGMFCVSSMAFLNDRVPESLKGTISGTFYFFWGMGYFFGPLLIGKFGTSIGFHTGFSFFSGLFMLHLMALSLVVKGGHRART